MSNNFTASGDAPEKPSSLFNVAFVIGPPGSGKGTQCINIQKHFNYVHLSAGDLLRAERTRDGSPYAELINTHICNGTIVPVEITCKLIENAMIAASQKSEGGSSVRGFLIDGFPRSMDNLNGWIREMSDKVQLRFVLVLSAPFEECVRRCLNRCEGRIDDNEETMKKRIVTYNEVTMPVINYFKERDLVRTVDATASKEEVYKAVEKVFIENGIYPIVP